MQRLGGGSRSKGCGDTKGWEVKQGMSWAALGLPHLGPCVPFNDLHYLMTNRGDQGVEQGHLT